MKTTEIPQLQAFIAAPADQSLKTLKDELIRRNVHAYTAYDLPAATTSIANSVEQAIKKADFMVAVVPAHASPNLFFELGMAHAMKKPLLVLVPPTFGILPSDIAGMLYLRIDPGNKSALSFALDQYLTHLESPSTRRKRKKKEETPLGEESNRFLAAIQSGNLTGSELECVVAEVLRAAGAEVVIESRHGDNGVDIAIWSDAIQSIAGNPVLVEVKKSIRSHHDLQQALEQVEQYRRNSGSKLGLLVVEATKADFSSIPIGSGVLAVILSDLLSKLRTKTLAETIRELRNETFHAGGK